VFILKELNATVGVVWYRDYVQVATSCT
jgi:hypothetical protein